MICHYCLFSKNDRSKHTLLKEYPETQLLCLNCQLKLINNIGWYSRRYSYYRTCISGKCSKCTKYVYFCENML